MPSGLIGPGLTARVADDGAGVAIPVCPCDEAGGGMGARRVVGGRGKGIIPDEESEDNCGAAMVCGAGRCWGAG